jgi:hypothetical protein
VVLALAVVTCALCALTGVPALAKGKKKGRDQDHDGLRDRVEVRRFHTNPRRRDTDRDGLKDGAEVKRYHTNPRKKDTDGDGLSDGAEVKRYHTNPRKKDTDGDGVPDGQEIRQGTSPTNPHSGPAPPPPSKTPPRPCGTVVSSGAAQSAVAGAAPGTVVCLSDGTYGHVDLNAAKSGEVVLQAQHPGAATIAGAKLTGSHLTVSRFRMTGTFEAAIGSTGMTADHNLFDLNAYSGYGAMVCAADDSDPTCNDISILNNRFVGRSEEDAIRANRYHNLVIRGNEFTGNQETGGHNDVFQSVWVGDHLTFSRNYLHDFGGQGFFVKDQASAIDGLVVEDNLIVRQNLPCDPTSLCPTWQLSPFQVFGPIANASIRHNTVWAQGGDALLRGSGWSNAAFSDNVFDKLGRDNAAVVGGSGNTRCSAVGEAITAGTTIACSPGFANPGAGDYRVAGGRGVSWTVANGDFGP